MSPIVPSALKLASGSALAIGTVDAVKSGAAVVSKVVA
jgi:hypothetical protein